MWRTMLMAALLATVMLAGCMGTQSDQTQAIIAATNAYLKANSDVGAVTVTVDKVDGDYARAEVLPTDESTDPAWVFLKRDHDAWVGLTIGTAFTPDDYQQLGIPQSLWPQ